ncbi:hypothetical protein KDX31_20465 (plasmid) [Amphritea atlantica]|uniref:Uncharacterized protein n=1 Tax=Amphritea atlantica TaxID=355243 RepID=A0ABY5H0R8_9GAMM|nr:hypothetical protein KDX31_20465 [Amphritea atlantica]
MTGILIVLRHDCMGGIPVLDDFFAFLDEIHSFSSNFSEIDLKLGDGYEKIAAYFFIGAGFNYLHKRYHCCIKHFLISTWACSALE